MKRIVTFRYIPQPFASRRFHALSVLPGMPWAALLSSTNGKFGAFSLEQYRSIQQVAVCGRRPALRDARRSPCDPSDSSELRAPSSTMSLQVASPDSSKPVRPWRHWRDCPAPHGHDIECQHASASQNGPSPRPQPLGQQIKAGGNGLKHMRRGGIPRAGCSGQGNQDIEFLRPSRHGEASVSAMKALSTHDGFMVPSTEILVEHRNPSGTKGQRQFELTL